MGKLKEHYIIFKGDDIVGESADLKKAEEIYDSTPPKKRLTDGRALYKLIKED